MTGAPDYWTRGKNASLRFSFRAIGTSVRSGGDLIVGLAALCKQFQAEGLTEPQKNLPRGLLPRRIRVITAEGGQPGRI